MNERVSHEVEGRETEGPDLKPVLREMLHEQIYAMLRRNLMMGRFGPGQKLPLRKLAASLGTSLMPVRDALQRLESVGCVVSTANRTMMVPNYSADELADIRMLRALLEGAAAEAAARRRTQAQLEALDRYCDDIQLSADTCDIDLFLEANYLFHMTIADASGISFITDLLEPLWMRIGPFVRQAKPGQMHIQRAVDSHLRARDAIAAGDADAARRAVQDDIIECYRT